MVNREDMFSHSAAQIKCVLIERVQVKTFGILGDYLQVKPENAIGESESTAHTDMRICCLPANNSKINVEKTNNELCS